MDSGSRPSRRLAAVVGTGAVVAALSVAGPGPAAATRPPPAPVVLAVGQPAPRALNTATAVSCGDVAHCWAVGFGTGTTAAIIASRTGGQHWAAQVVPASVSALASVSCVGRSDCLAVGSAAGSGAVVSTRDGGATWTLASNPQGAAAVTAIQCAVRQRCVALATDGMSYWAESTSTLGATWVRGGALPSGYSAAGLWCPSSSICLAAGYTSTGPGRGAGAIARTIDGGATWSPATIPSGVGVLRTVSCAGATCLAAGTSSSATTGFVPGGGELLASADGGATWHPAQSGSAGDAFGASCPDRRTCLVVGTEWVGTAPSAPTASIVTTLDGGLHWRPAQLRYVPVGMAAVSCPAVNSCEAVGGDVLVHISLPVAPQKGPAKPGGRAGSGIR